MAWLKADRPLKDANLLQFLMAELKDIFVKLVKGENSIDFDSKGDNFSFFSISCNNNLHGWKVSAKEQNQQGRKNLHCFFVCLVR